MDHRFHKKFAQTLSSQPASRLLAYSHGHTLRCNNNNNLINGRAEIEANDYSMDMDCCWHQEMI